jgi:hypothetical protein
MTRIRLHAHPFEAEGPRIFDAPSIGEWLLRHYGARPGREVHVYAGEPSRETDLTGNVAALLRNDAPLYVVLEAPGFEPVSWSAILVNLAITTAASLVLNLLLAKDPKPLDNRRQESPNNALSARENRLRALERVEDIFGTVRSIPSLMMASYTKYIANRQVEYALLCITRGYAQVSDIREGDTPLDEISGASARVYWPFTSPNSGSAVLSIGDPIIDPVLNVKRGFGVDGVVLKPLNQIQLPDPSNLSYGVSFGYDTLTQAGWAGGPKPNFLAIAAVGQTLTISGTNQVVTFQDESGVEGTPVTTITAVASTKTYTSTTAGFFRSIVNGTPITFVGFGDPLNTATKTVASHTDNSVTVVEAVADESGSVMSVTATIGINGTRTIVEVGDGFVRLQGPIQFPAGPVAASFTVVVNNGQTEWTNWTVLPQVDRTEVWTNVVALSGMYKDDGSKSTASVSYEIQIEKLDPVTLAPTGVVETVTGNVSGAASAEQAETLEHVTAWVGPARVRARRTTPYDYDFQGAVVDEITWTDVYAVAPVTKLHFGNKTIIHTVTHATIAAAAVRNRQLNCLASRLLPTYDGAAWSGAFDATGLHTTGTIHATSRIIDILAAVTQDPQIGGRPLTDLDVAQVWSVQQALDAWNTECGQFNYTFDSDQLSYEETVNAIADAAFCRGYRQNGMIRLALDRPQPAGVALFSHRSKQPGAEQITRTFANDSEYDGVELVYVDPETDNHETIRLPVDGSFTKLKRVEVTGIRSYEQAWLRANREYQRLRYQRLALETVVTTEARALLPNSRIENVDNTKFKSYDGEVLAQIGLELTLSREVEFVPATAHSIVLKHRNGSIEAVTVTAGSASNRVVLAAPPAEAIVTEADPDVGVRTEFSFAADTARGVQAWLVQEIEPPDAGYMRIRAINYAPEYYAADSLAIPAKATVIF